MTARYALQGPGARILIQQADGPGGWQIGVGACGGLVSWFSKRGERAFGGSHSRPEIDREMKFDDRRHMSFEREEPTSLPPSSHSATLLRSLGEYRNASERKCRHVMLFWIARQMT